MCVCGSDIFTSIYIQVLIVNTADLRVGIFGIFTSISLLTMQTSVPTLQQVLTCYPPEASQLLIYYGM